ncbi:MAG: magnesium transporter [Oscillospiraceae bacterium]|nr:magnesium transporter [Oscillospiraceae bacterium]MBQ4315854.1 magnesium transporter [Oscillospiraceae bacterium]
MGETTVTIEKMITALLDERKFATLRDVLDTMAPADIAALLDDMPHERMPLLFRLLSKELAAEAFVEMDADLQESLIRGFSDSELKEVVDELYVDDAVDIIEEMPANVVKRILRQADPDMRKMINEILKYPDDSAGSIMTMEYVSFKPDLKVSEAIKNIRRSGVDKETVYTCYVTEKDRKLIGIVTVRSLLMADDDALISDIMEENVISVYTTDDREDVANNFAKYDFLALPVVDRENRLVGIVTVDDAIDVIREEATEDIEKMAAITPTDKPYLKTSAFELWKARIPWLLLLMLSSTFTGIIITHFENALAATSVLAAYIPMLMGTGGNSGSQASVAVIRGLSLDEIEFSDIFRVLWKEIRVSVMSGVTLAAANFVKLITFDRVGASVALVVSLALAVTVFTAKLVGCSLPILSKKIGFDPAVMASPFITTIVDAISLLIYFTFASALL